MPHKNEDIIRKKVEEARLILMRPGKDKKDKAIALLNQIEDLLDERPRLLYIGLDTRLW